MKNRLNIKTASQTLLARWTTIAAALAIAIGGPTHITRAASTSWKAAPADAQWSNTGNWNNAAGVGSTTTTNNDIATFNTAIAVVSGSNVGDASNPIVIDAARKIGGITFTSASVGAYQIGTNTGNSLTLRTNSGATDYGTNNQIQIASSATNAQVIAAPIFFGQASSTAGAYGFVSNSLTSTATLSFTGTITSNSSRSAVLSLDGSNTGANIISGPIVDTASVTGPYLIKRGVGTWTLSGANTFTGTVTTDTSGNLGIQIIDGTLIAANNTALGSAGNVWIRSSGFIYANNQGNVTINSTGAGGTLEIANGITLDNGVILNMLNGGTLRGAGTSAVNSTVKVSGSTSQSVTLRTVTGSDVFTIGNAANDFTGGASDTVTHIAGPGTVVLSNSSNYAGTISVDAGTLRLGANTALGTQGSLNIASGAKLQTFSVDPTVTVLTGSGTVENGNAGTSTLTTSIASGTNTFAGVIQDGAAGTQALTKTGVGALNLNGNSTYTGATIVSAGTLNVAGRLGNTAVSATNTGILAGSGTIAGAVTVFSGAAIAPGNSVGTIKVGSLTLNAGSQLNYDITNTSTLDQITVSNSGGLTINGGQLNINGGASLFTTNGVYNLIGYTGAIGGTGASALSVNASNKDIATKSYTFDANGSFVTLTIANAATSASFWNVNSDGNWSVAGNWTAGVPNAVSAFAAFGGGGTEITQDRAISVDGNFTVGTISLNGAANSKAYTLANGGGSLILDSGTTAAAITNTASSNNIAAPLVLTANGVAANVVQTADTLTVSGIVSGTGALTKVGSGTLALTGSNSFVGNTTINAGTVAINNANGLGDSANVATINAGTLRATADITSGRSFTVGDAASTISVDATRTYSINGVIGGSGVLNKSGSGTLALTGSNTYTGGTVINAGTVAINSASSLGDVNGVATINNGTLEVTSGFTTARNFSVGDANSTIQTDSAVNYVVTGTIGGSGSLNKTGSGKLVLTAANNYTGNTIITGGTLQMGNNGSTGTLGSGTAVFQGGTLTNGYATGSTYSMSQNVFVASGQAGTINMGEKMVMSGAVSGSGTLNVNVGTTSTRDDLTGSWSAFTGQLNFGGSGGLRLLTQGGSFSGFGTASVDLEGSVLFVPHNFSGGATTNFGMLTGTSTTAGLGSSDLGGQNIWSIGALNTSGTFAGQITAGSVVKVGSGTLTLTGTNSTYGTTTVSAGTLQIGNGGTAGSLGTGTVTDNAVLVFNRSDAVTVGNTITGSGSMAVIGSGTTSLTAGNSYTGLTTISNGSTLNINGQFALGGAVYGGMTFNNGTLQYATGFSGNGTGDITQNSLNVAKNVTLTGNATIDTNGNDVTYANTFGNSGTGSLTKTGLGKLTLNGVNTYTGTTSINGGTLSINSNGSLGGGANGAAAVAINNGATLDTTASVSTSRAISLGTTQGGTSFNDFGGSGVPSQATAALSVAGNASNTLGNVWDTNSLQLQGQLTGTTGSRLVVTRGSGSGNALLFLDNEDLGNPNSTLGAIYFHGSSPTGTTNADGTALDNLVVKTFSAPQFGNSPIFQDGGATLVSNQDGLFSAVFSIGSGGAVRETKANRTVFRTGSILNMNNGSNFGGLTAQGDETSGGTLGSNAGTLGLGGHNSFGGSGQFVTIGSNFTLSISDDLNLGASGNALKINGGILAIEDGIYHDNVGNTDTAVQANVTTSRAIALSGSSNFKVSNSYNAAFDLGTASYAAQKPALTALETAKTSVNTFTVDGVIADGASAGTLTKTGVGKLVLTAPNTYSGGTVLNSGTTSVNNSSGSGTGTGQVTVASAAALNGTGSIAGSVVVSGALSGSLTLNGDLTVNSSATAAASAFNGNVVNNGTINSAVTMQSGKTLSGGGTINGAVTASGGSTVSPGNSAGTLAVNGNLTLGDAGTAHLAMQIGGTTAGTGYDQVVMNGGTLNLTNVNLDGSLLSFTPVPGSYNISGNLVTLGDVFYLVVGVGTLNGNFANETAGNVFSGNNPTITFDGQKFAIFYEASYNGGVASTLDGGSDIALMAIPEPNTWAMLLGGLGVLIGFQRARRRQASRSILTIFSEAG